MTALRFILAVYFLISGNLYWEATCTADMMELNGGPILYGLACDSASLSSLLTHAFRKEVLTDLWATLQKNRLNLCKIETPKILFHKNTDEVTNGI